MSHTSLIHARGLDDAALLAHVARLTAHERGATADLVAHLAEVETRQLHLARGFSSMFTYCVEGLGLAEHAAYNRIEAARTARRFPTILDLLASGGIHLSTVRVLAPHLTESNYAEVLANARGLRKRQVEELVARLAPVADVPTSIRRLPAAPTSRPVAGVEPSSPLLEQSPAAPAVATAFTPPPEPQRVSTPLRPAPQTAAVAPLAPDRYKLQLTISGETLAKLDLARDMLRHTLPYGDEAAILDRALSVLLVELAKAKFAISERRHTARKQSLPEKERSDAGDASGAMKQSRHIPAAVRRAVFLRDRGRCAYSAGSGRRYEAKPDAGARARPGASCRDAFRGTPSSDVEFCDA